jgi:hypothetical protein
MLLREPGTEEEGSTHNATWNEGELTKRAAANREREQVTRTKTQIWGLLRKTERATWQWEKRLNHREYSPPHTRHEGRIE